MNRIVLPLSIVVVTSCALTELPPPGSGTEDDDDACTEDEKICGGACVATNAPETGCRPDSCDACFAGHPARCEATECACIEGFADCDGVPTNGCEVDVLSDARSCGACGLTCTSAFATPACVDGQCALGDCAPGRRDCNEDASDGCETDIATDAAHCGACGYDCHGGGCDAGACELVVLAEAQGDPLGIDTDGVSVFWSDGGAETGTVKRMTISDDLPAPQPDIVASQQKRPTRVLVHGGRVYWLTGTHLRSAEATDIDVPGSPLAPVTCGTSLAASETHLYWAQVVIPGCPGSTVLGVQAVPLSGGGSASLVPGSSDNFVIGMRARGERVFWTDLTGGRIFRASGLGPAEAICESITSPRVLTVDGTTLFVAAGADGSDTALYALDIDNTTAAPELLAQHPGTTGVPLDIEVDATHVYWTDRSSINRVPRTGGTVEVVVAGQLPRQFVMDAETVFWTDGGSGGSIRRIAK